jgi:hypothetical protein
MVPVILDGDSINNYPISCSVASIKAQLGTPLKVDESRGNVVLLYNAKQLQALPF